MLGDDDGESRAGDDQPPRRQRRKGQCDQPGGNDGATVAQEQRERFAAQLEHQRFRCQCRKGGERYLDENGRADLPDVGGDAG